MKITHRFIANVLLFFGFFAVLQGRTLTPESGSLLLNNSNKTVQITSLPIFTSPHPDFTTTKTTTSSNNVILAQNKQDRKTGTSNVTAPAAAEGHDDSGKDGLPLWGYILIGIGAVVVIVLCAIFAYAKFVKWKDHGTYMVWDDAELETSPAFTRESEFLLETQGGFQENTPELQLYEIPLDSVPSSHPKISYMGARRVAPKKQEEKRRPSKDYKKKDGEYHTPSLTKYTKRDTVYNSVTDTCITSVLSDGTLDGHESTSSHTLATVMFSNGGLDKYGSSSQFSTIDNKQRDKSHSMGSRTRSVSNLIQSRPLPAVPIINKRFSKSLDKFRFFNTLPVIKTNDAPRAGLLYGEPPYSNLVKSASYGSNLHRTVNNNICLPVMLDQAPLFATRKSSLDIHSKIPVKLNHRKSKSLDTLTLLKGMDFSVANVDVYHSYESVHNKDAEYASVSDSQPNSPTSDFTPQHSPTKLHSPTDHEGVYSSLSHENLHRKESLDEGKDNCNVGYDSGTLSSVSSDATSPYACVRISQIPGLSCDQSDHDEECYSKATENSGESFESMTPENSGSSAVQLKPGVNSARSSTHTYIELLPEQNHRDSTISETSSGYARPVDIINGVNVNKNSSDLEEEKTESLKRRSLTDVEIPIEPVSFDESNHDNDEVYVNPVSISDEASNDASNVTSKVTAPDGINLDDSVDDIHINIRPLLKRSDSDHSECEI